MTTLTGIITPTNLVTLTGTATLTNKTLTSPTIASANLTTALTLAGAAGTNGQVLTSAGSGLPSWATPSAGALVYLSTVTASASSTVDIETTFNSTYDTYLLVAEGIRPVDDAVSLYLRMKIGGAYNSSAAYNAHVAVCDFGSTAYAGIISSSATAVQMTGAVGSAATRHVDFQMYISRPTSTTQYQAVNWNGGNYSGSVLTTASGAAISTVTGALTGLRFYFATGSVSVGTFRLYGIVKS